MSLAATLAGKFRTAAAQPASVWLWIVPSWMLIGTASALIVVLPFRWIARRLGHQLGSVSLTPVVTPVQQRRAHDLMRAIAIAAEYAPFRADCLPQAITARILCGLLHIPYALHLGVSTDTALAEDNGLAAHAWVVSGAICITGGIRSFRSYATVSCFVSRALWQTVLRGTQETGPAVACLPDPSVRPGS